MFNATTKLILLFDADSAISNVCKQHAQHCCGGTYLRSNCQQRVDNQWHIASTRMKAFVLTGYFFLQAFIQLRASLACCFTSSCDGASGSALLPLAPPFFCMTGRVITYRFHRAFSLHHIIVEHQWTIVIASYNTRSSTNRRQQCYQCVAYSAIGEHEGAMQQCLASTIMYTMSKNVKLSPSLSHLQLKRA